jgi:hypothetical protein
MPLKAFSWYTDVTIEVNLDDRNKLDVFLTKKQKKQKKH